MSCVFVQGRDSGERLLIFNLLTSSSDVNWILHINNDDVAVTRAIAQAGKLLDVDVLDHIVIGQSKWVLLKERGLGFS